MNIINISDSEFGNIKDILYEKTGIFLNDSKRNLVSNRLRNRIISLNLSSLSDYLKILENGDFSEIQLMIDNMTTNETFFFREEKHFALLEDLAKSEEYSSGMKVWSAACSTGEEVYSIAMVLSNSNVQEWKVVGSDINESVIMKAKAGIYPIEKARNIPDKYLKTYCYRGIKSNHGKFRIGEGIKSNVEFRKINLIHTLPDIGEFDVIFLRNVMIYFDAKSKEKVISSVTGKLKNGGYLIVSHTESLLGLANNLKFNKKSSSIYRKTTGVCNAEKN